MARSKTSDAVDSLRRRFVDGDAEREALVRQERDNLDVAQQAFMTCHRRQTLPSNNSRTWLERPPR